MWRQIRTPQWLHALNWPVQFTWPHTCEYWSIWLNINVRYCCLMWEYCPVRTTRIWPNEAWFCKSVSSYYEHQKHVSEPITYVVCCGQTDLTRISDPLQHIDVRVWQSMGLFTHTITTSCTGCSPKRWNKNTPSTFMSSLTSDTMSPYKCYLSANCSSDG